MLNRLVNALATRVAAQLQPFVAAAVAEQRAADQKQVRELVAEMEDVLEKFSRVVAREGNAAFSGSEAPPGRADHRRGLPSTAASRPT